MDTAARVFAPTDDSKALGYLKSGRSALERADFQNAMRNFKKCNKLRITKPLTALLLNQMAFCMEQLEFYDQQQEYLEELCELEPNFTNVNQLMKLYISTNNEIKRAAFADKIKKLTAENEDEEKQIIQMLVQAKDHDEVIIRCLEWFKKNSSDVEIAKYIINTYIEQKKIEEAVIFTENHITNETEPNFYLELSSLRKECFDYEGTTKYIFRHFELNQDNIYGINKLAQTLMSNASYHGTLTDDEYIEWKDHAATGTIPQSINNYFNIDTGLFRRIRVGFISYDFRKHSIGKFIMSLFDAISNNTGLETYCYYTFPDFEDDFTAVIKDRADVFKSVGRYSDKQLRKELLDDNLDILVDLNGQTAGTKLPLLAERFAPIQITWMGFPFSSFYYNIDYIIGDYFFDPIDGETEKFCSEKILRMEPCYMCFALDTDYHINPEPPQTRNGYITFGMMNNPNKYSKEAIRLWQKCLEATPGSRLLFQLSSYMGPYVEMKFRERLEKFGLDLSRVDFGTDYGQAGYYGTYNKVDVMLDSFPFGGGTTTPEAIWMGVPVIGCQYHMRHGRMAYSFMSNVGLGNLCADSIDDYPNKVRKVSQNVELLRDLRQNLRGKLKETPLFDTGVFRNAFENAIRDVFVDYCIENKKPYDSTVYENDEGLLLRDCVRAADILVHEITRKKDAGDERFAAMFDEYKTIHALMMERILDIYQDDRNSLLIAVQAADMLEMLDTAPDLETINAFIKSIRSVLYKFA